LKHQLDFRYPAIANDLLSERTSCRVSEIQMGQSSRGSVVCEFDLVQAVGSYVLDRIVDAISIGLVEHRGPRTFGPGFTHEKGCGGVFVEHRALLYPLVGTMHKIAFPSWNPFVLFDRASEGEHRIHGCSDPRLIVDLQRIGPSHSTHRQRLYRSPHPC
jgi:hypothetical protein